MSIPNNHPHWKRMRFKRNKVWMAVDADSRPILENNKVLIKYQLNQEHEYWVHLNSLTALDESSPKAAPPSLAKGSQHQIPAEKNQNAIQIYTDGACSGNPGPAGIGVVMRYKGREKEISRHIGTATNNIAELEAIHVALKSIKNRNLPVVLYTDSSYALGLLTKGWKAKQNVELIQKIRDLTNQFAHLQFIKIKGHAGHADNERADRLAVKAIEGDGKP